MRLYKCKGYPYNFVGASLKKWRLLPRGINYFMQPARRFLVSRMGTSETYNGRYLNIRTCDFKPLSVQLRCRANIFPPYYPAHAWFRISPIDALSSHSVRVCPHLCWDEVFISGFCVIWLGIINKRPLNWVAKLRQIMVSVQFSQQTELTPSNAHCTAHGLLTSEQGA